MPSSEHTSPNRARLQRVLSTSLLRRRSRTSTASETSHPPLLTASSPPTVAPGRVRRLFTRLLLGRRRATAMRTAIVGCEVPLPLRQLAATSGQRTGMYYLLLSAYWSHAAAFCQLLLDCSVCRCCRGCFFYCSRGAQPCIMISLYH